MKTAYVACAKSLQKKMPINNPILKGCAALCWTVRRSSTAERYLKGLAKVTVTTFDSKTQKQAKKHVLVQPDDCEAFENEVVLYTTTPSIPTPAPGTSIDAYWAQMDTTKFPLLTAVAKKLVSAFHGPAVEASFSSMGEILHAGCSQMDISTYSAIQCVRYFLQTRPQLLSTLQRKTLCQNQYRSNWQSKCGKRGWQMMRGRKAAEMHRKVILGAPVQKPATKTAEKKKILAEGQQKETKSTKQPASSVAESPVIEVLQRTPEKVQNTAEKILAVGQQKENSSKKRHASSVLETPDIEVLQPTPKKKQITLG